MKGIDCRSLARWAGQLFASWAQPQAAARYLDRMMSEHDRAAPSWLPYLDLVCVTIAGGLWYASHQWWPLAIAAAPWLIRIALTGRLSQRTVFDVPLVLFLLTAVVGIWAAYDREAAWGRFWMIVGGVFVFYALANAESAGRLRAWYLALFGAGVAAHFLLTHDWEAYATKIDFLARLGQALQPPLPPLPGPHPNPNVAGGTLAMLLPFAGLVVVRARRDLREAPQPRPAGLWLALGLGLVSLVLVAFGLVMTISRSSWIAVLGALLLAGMWLVAGRLSRANPARRGWIFAGLLGLGLVIALVAILAVPGVIDALLDALPGPGSIGARADLRRNSLTLLRDYPLTGIGLDSFLMTYSSYVMLLHVGYAEHAHNLFLDVAVEQGLPALLILLWMCVLFFRQFWRDQMGPEARQRSSEMGAAALSLLVILLHGLADDPLYKSHAVLLFFVPLAFAGPPARQHWLASRWRAVGLPVVLLLLLGLALVWREPILSLVYSNLGAVHQSQAELGVYSWPEWPIQDAVRREVDLGQPVAEFERALALDPRNATAN
ncbi:MAG: O-antigen ligase family protein, partial [Anaerolineae bacterium]